MSLALLGLWLAAVGLADLGRTSIERPRPGRAAACVAAGWAALAVGLLLLSVGPAPRVWLVLGLGVLLAGWVLVPRRRVAVPCLVAGVLVSVLAGGVVVEDRGWPRWLDGTVLVDHPTSLVLLVVGVLLFQLSSANLVVRHLLDAVGVPATTNEKQLRGGRVLGPMERVLLVCLGGLGEATAAAIVIAAKGLLRFPELQRAQRRADPEPAGPSDVTEYFLIGSLASWLIALGGAGLLRLAT